MATATPAGLDALHKLFDPALAGPVHEMPIGGGGGSQGFIAPWTLRWTRKVWCAHDSRSAAAENPYDLPKDEWGWTEAVVFPGSGISYVWGEAFAEQAEKASQYVVSIGKSASTSGRGGAFKEIMIQTPKVNVMNFGSAEAMANWNSDPVSYSVSVASYTSSAWNRWIFNLAFMPSVVAAAARLAGFEVDWNLNELAHINPDLPYAKADALLAFSTKKLETSEAFARRAKLWAGLGESDPTAHTLIEGKPYYVRSELLRFMLRSVYVDWGRPIYARIGTLWNYTPEKLEGDLIDDKMIAAEPNSFKRAALEARKGEKAKVYRNVPIVLEIFSDQPAAQKAAQADIERFAKGGAVASAGGPALPAAYDTPEFAEGWPKMLTSYVIPHLLKLKAENPATPAHPGSFLERLAGSNGGPGQFDAELKSEFFATGAELLPWVKDNPELK